MHSIDERNRENDKRQRSSPSLWHRAGGASQAAGQPVYSTIIVLCILLCIVVPSDSN